MGVGTHTQVGRASVTSWIWKSTRWGNWRKIESFWQAVMRSVLRRELLQDADERTFISHL